MFGGQWLVAVWRQLGKLFLGQRFWKNDNLGSFCMFFPFLSPLLVWGMGERFCVCLPLPVGEGG